MPVEADPGAPALERLCDLLDESLVLWDVAGTVAVMGAAVVIRAAAARVAVRPSRTGQGLFRWFVVGEDGRERPCTSVLGVLRAVRAALGREEPAPRLRIGGGVLAP
jgi:hypothetical protein